MILYIALLGVMISDIITTELAIRKQGAEEVNPIMKNSKVRAILELLNFPIPLILYYFRTKGHKWIDTITFFIITFRGLIVGNNLRYIISANLRRYLLEKKTKLI